MGNQLGSSELEYDRLTGRTTIAFTLFDGRKIRLIQTLGEDDFQQFDVRWERFKVSDEIFFDLGEFARFQTT